MKFIILFFSITIILLFQSWNSKSQMVSTIDSTVTTYLHINPIFSSMGYGGGFEEIKIIGFVLTNIDTLGKSNWQSKRINEFKYDGKKYFVKVDLPSYVLNNSREIWCTAIEIKFNGYGFDTIETDYGGVHVSSIKLILKSDPEGAETFLIPNRIWKKKFEKSLMRGDDSEVQNFRVNTSRTNTYAYVDETVFVVVFKINSKFKKIIHHTKPFSVEPEQTVWTNF
jgi:hypothetical protein